MLVFVYLYKKVQNPTSCLFLYILCTLYKNLPAFMFVFVYPPIGDTNHTHQTLQNKLKTKYTNAGITPRKKKEEAMDTLDSAVRFRYSPPSKIMQLAVTSLNNISVIDIGYTNKHHIPIRVMADSDPDTATDVNSLMFSMPQADITLLIEGLVKYLDQQPEASLSMHLGQEDISQQSNAASQEATA